MPDPDALAAAAALGECRARFRSDGVEGVARVGWRLDPALHADPTGPDGQELVGWDALALGRPGWAYVCLMAAAEGRPEPQATETRADAARILRESFEPYPSEEALLGDLRRWLPVRLGALAQQASDEADGRRPARSAPLDSADELRLQWWLRWRATLLHGIALPLDLAGGRLGLDERDRWLLRLLLALDGQGARPLALMDLWAEDPAERARVAERLGAEGGLRRWGLIEEGDGALRTVAEVASMARGASTLATLPADAEPPPVPPPLRSRLERAFAADRQPACLALTGAAALPGARLVAAWAAGRGRRTLLVRGAAELAPVPLARAAKLSEAVLVVLIGPGEGPPPWLDGLCIALDEPVVVVGATVPLRQLPQPAARGRVRMERAELGPADWNAALRHVGLAPLPEDRLRSVLTDVALTRGQLRATVQAAAIAAWTAPGSGSVLTPSPEALRALAQQSTQEDGS